MERSKQAEICERIARKAIVPKGKTMSDVVLAFRRAKGKKRYRLPLLVKIKDRGKIEVGRKADMVLMDKELNVLKTMINGEWFYEK